MLLVRGCLWLLGRLWPVGWVVWMHAEWAMRDLGRWGWRERGGERVDGGGGGGGGCGERVCGCLDGAASVCLELVGVHWGWLLWLWGLGFRVGRRLKVL